MDCCLRWWCSRFRGVISCSCRCSSCCHWVACSAISVDTVVGDANGIGTPGHCHESWPIRLVGSSSVAGDTCRAAKPASGSGANPVVASRRCLMLSARSYVSSFATSSWGHSFVRRRSTPRFLVAGFDGAPEKCPGAAPGLGLEPRLRRLHSLLRQRNDHDLRMLQIGRFYAGGDRADGDRRTGTRGLR